MENSCALNCVPVRKGPVVGHYQGRPIHEYLDFGTTQWCFSHVAIMDRDGMIDMDQLADDECVVSPGLVYRKKEAWRL